MQKNYEKEYADTFYDPISQARSKELAAIVIKMRKNTNATEVKKLGRDQVRHHDEF